MLCVLFAEDCLVYWYMPVNPQRIIQDTDATIGLWMIELIALILEDSCLREDGKTMGETLGDKELTVIILCQFHCNMLAVGRTPLADVYSDIKDGTLHTAHQFALGEWWTLEMQASHHTIG